MSEALSLFTSHASCATCGHRGCSGRTSLEHSAAAEGEILPPCSGRWPDAGIISHGVFSTLAGLDCPSVADGCTLPAYLDLPPVPSRYWLTPTALAGIRRRLVAKGLMMASIEHALTEASPIGTGRK